LKNNGGYANNSLKWGSVSKLGLKYEGEKRGAAAQQAVQQGKTVLLNVHNGGHWVLATGYVVAPSISNIT
jgi:hypothetical protein